MAIIGESFEEYINDQIKVRQKTYGSKDRTPEQLTYLNGRTAWVRLISSVNIKNDPNGENDEGTKKLQACGLDNSYLGSRLAREYVLFAGTSNAATANPSIRDLRRGIDPNSNSGAYGIGGTEFGLQPMPTLGDVEIKYKNRGSLRESNLTIKCFNPQQFQIIDTLYLHLGYTVLLEWGNSSYFNNEGGYVSNNRVSMQELMFDSSVQQTHLEVLKSILDKREKSNGNYDAFYGKIANYSWTFDNGVYNISLKLISLGDIIESLNMNYLSAGVGEELGNDEEEEVEKTIKSEKDKNDLARLFFTLSDPDQFRENSMEMKGGIAILNFPQKPSLKIIAERAGFPGDFSDIESAFIKVAISSKFETKNNYIRFSSLLEFLEKTQLLYSKQNNPLINFDYRIGNSYMVTNKWIISSNPSFLLINPGTISLSNELKSTYKGSDLGGALELLAQLDINGFLEALDDSPSSIFNILTSLPEFKRVDNGFNSEIGDIMNIYLEVNKVFDILLENLDEKTGITPIFKFLDSICSVINNTLGNLGSIAPFIDESTNTLSIIEEGELPHKDKLLKELEKNQTNHPLQLHGYSDINTVDPKAGFVKSFNLKTEITNDLATMISIGAQASGEVVKGIDATAFASWNRGLVDRIIPIKKPNTEDTDKKDGYSDFGKAGEIYDPLDAESRTPQNASANDNPDSKLLKKYKTGLGNYVGMLEAYIGSNLNKDDFPSFTSGLRAAIDYNKELIKLEKETKNNGKTIGVTQPGFLPINLNVTLDGISGPTILQQFEAEGRFLPHPIPDTLTFLIKGVNHKISNNVWTTTIDSLSVPKFVKSQPTTTTSNNTRSNNTRSNNKRLSECEVLMVDGFATPSTYGGKDIKPPRAYKKVSMNPYIKNDIFTIIESDEYKSKYTKGHRMMALAYVIKEGYYKKVPYENSSSSYKTKNPGNIGNTDSGVVSVQPNIKTGMNLLMGYFTRVATGKARNYPFGNVVIPQFFSEDINKRYNTYLRPDGCLPGYRGNFQGELGFFVKKYATFARVNNNGITGIWTIFSINGYNEKIDHNTLIQDLLDYNPSNQTIELK